MAKSTANDTAKPAADTAKPVSARITKQIEELRRPFTDYVASYTLTIESRGQLAPRFMKAFGAWQAETAGSFVDFVRILDPNIGTTREEYRAARAYQAAEYLRRIAQPRQERRETSGAGSARPSSPMVATARTLAAIFPLLPDDQREKVWEAVRTQLHWTERQVSYMQGLLSESTPLFDVRAPRGAVVPQLRVTAHHEAAHSAAA